MMMMMDTTQNFLFYLKYVWQAQRLFVSKPKRCKKCILSEDYIEISPNGLCSLCNSYKQPNEISYNINSNDNIDTIINENIDKNNCYDATLLLSGGKDSAYILHRLRLLYPRLKILCLCINNGFMSEWAVKNVEYTSNKLDVDLLIVNSHVNEFRQTFRDAFLKLDGRGCYSVIDFADGNLIFQIGENITKKLNIPLMISGLSWVQLEKILCITSCSIEKNKITQLFPLYQWRTNEQDIRQYVRNNELLVRGSDSPLVSNSLLVPTMIYFDIKNLKYSSFEPEFSQLIREGKSDRKSWLYIAELCKYFVEHGYLDKEVKHTLSKLGLTIGQIL